MLFEDITIIDENFKVCEHKYVGTKGAFIDYIGDSRPKEDYVENYNGRGKLLMPAFFNAHAHSPMMLMRGYGENLTLSDWLNTRIFPFEDKLNPEAIYSSTLLAMAESLRFGIVSTSDMYYFCEDMARAIIKSGAKANISRSIASFNEGSIIKDPRYMEAESLYRNFHGADAGRILVDASLHAEYTNTETSIREVADFAKSHNINMQIHVSETKSEHEACKSRHGGRTPIKLLYDLGALETNTTAAHCVWVDSEDMDIMAEKGVTVASCPVSNLKLASGVCNVPELLRRKINVAIGTDSVASNNSLNFIEEMKFFALLNKERRANPTLITPEETLYAATYGGALAQGRPDCGMLKVGYHADLIVVDLDVPHLHPVHNLLTNIIYSASGSDVILTMADGRVLYKNGEYLTIDIEKTISDVETNCKKILESL